MNHKMAAAAKNSAPIIALSRALTGKAWNSKPPIAPGQSQRLAVTRDWNIDGYTAFYIHLFGQHTSVRTLSIRGRRRDTGVGTHSKRRHSYGSMRRDPAQWVFLRTAKLRK
jgi:hypothetical protein